MSNKIIQQGYWTKVLDPQECEDKDVHKHTVETHLGTECSFQRLFLN